MQFYTNVSQWGNTILVREYKKGERVAKDIKVELVMGISFDELQRMKINQLKYIFNQYPLVENAIRRHNCLEWLENGLQIR